MKIYKRHITWFNADGCLFVAMAWDRKPNKSIAQITHRLQPVKDSAGIQNLPDMEENGIRGEGL